MKQFLNVLYRRILYKIPLKFLLILLAVLAVLIASAKADDVYTLAGITDINSKSLNTNYQTVFSNNNIVGKTVCFKLDYTIGSSNNISVGFCGSSNCTPANPIIYFPDHSNKFVCMIGNTYFVAKTYANTATINGGEYFILNDLLDTDLPLMTSLQCQTEYNLIPISSVDQNYCTTNNLCPAVDCPVCPAGSGSVSTLYINDILHVGAPFIYLDIPEEIGREYGYTQGGTNMLIDVEGYNVDYEAVQNVIDQQNYKPTQEDFQNLILLLGPYGKIIIFFVFLFILWAWIKKPFKSKL